MGPGPSGAQAGVLPALHVAFLGGTVPGASLASLCEKAGGSHISWKNPCSFLLLLQANSPMPPLGSQG